MASESVDYKIGAELLQKQIEQAQSLLQNRPLKSEDQADWSLTTQAALKKIYGERSPNIDTIIRAPGSLPAWMGMSAADAERYEASRVENQIGLLSGCVTSLRLKAKQASEAVSKTSAD